jgi:hypothetical protein
MACSDQAILAKQKDRRSATKIAAATLVASCQSFFVQKEAERS